MIKSVCFGYDKNLSKKEIEKIKRNAKRELLKAVESHIVLNEKEIGTQSYCGEKVTVLGGYCLLFLNEIELGKLQNHLDILNDEVLGLKDEKKYNPYCK